MDKLFLVDVSGWVFRAYFAIPEMTNDEGESTHALFGFVRTMLKLIKDFEPTHLVAVFDGPHGKDKRTAIYKDYKAHREEAPADLRSQMERASEFCTLMGIPQLSIPGVEADDTIGTIAHQFGQNEIYICTADKDLCQLVNENVFILNTHKENLIVDAKGVEEQFGVRPSQIADLLGLMGDSSDNIPGLPGIGKKTAAALLQEFDTLDNLLENADKVSGKKRQETLKNEAELARLSRDLATIHLDVEIPHEISAYKLSTPDQEGLIAFYKKMKFRSLLRDAAKETRVDEEGRYHLVKEPKELLAKLKQHKTIIFDTETTGLRPLEAKMVGIGFAVEPGEGWYFSGNAAPFASLFADPSISWVAHNAKYDAHILANQGIEIANIAFDTMIASQLLDAHERAHSLDHLSLQYFGKSKTPISSLIGTGKKQKSMAEIPAEEIAAYCGEDVDYTLRLYHALKERKPGKVFEEIEMPLLPVLVRMERAGMYIDTDQLAKMSEKLVEEIKRLEGEIHTLAGKEFKVSSPKQLSEILYTELGIKPTKKTATGYSTNADVLAAMDHPIAAKILEYRTLEKLRSTYVDTLPTMVDLSSGRVHPTFNQLGAATGRLSCQDPNLQNIPARGPGREIRSAFRPQKPGWCYLCADYSQIELRLLAHLSGDPGLVKAFKEGKDIHSATAAAVFDTPLEKVTKQQRFQAKAVNFGLIYGQQAYGLSQNLGISVKEAAKFIETYFARYPNVQSYLHSCQEGARKEKRTTTMTGRERLLPEIDSKNPAIRSAAERLAVNTPLQGSAADLIKLAMIQMDSWLRKHQVEAQMILQVHDELIFELPESETDKLKKIVRTIMEGVWELEVPLIVDLTVGKNWQEC